MTTATTPDYPWLSPQLGEVPSLSLSERLLTFIAGYTAAGNLDGLEQGWRALETAHYGEGIEAILQTHLFAGYPRAINAMTTVRKLGADQFGEYHEGHDENVADWEASGTALCGEIYGGNYPKLREKMATIHPDLDKWMLQTGYGRVLSRPGLTPRLRELCVIAVLTGQNVTPQLFSHLRGAVNVGASVAECESILKQTQFIWGDEAQVQALKVFEKVRPKL